MESRPMRPYTTLILPAHSTATCNKHFPTHCFSCDRPISLRDLAFPSIKPYLLSSTIFQYSFKHKPKTFMDNKNCLALETELRLGLPGATVKDKKRLFADISSQEEKAPVVGWPPVCSYRRRNVGIKMYVKVSVDGAPFLRKIDLSNHKCYSHLVLALEQLFGCFGIGEALKDAENCEYVPIYEDKDGDWMLLGDVPWGMFAESCKRLRIMKKSDAKRIGLHAKDLLKGLATED